MFYLNGFAGKHASNVFAHTAIHTINKRQNNQTLNAFATRNVNKTLGSRHISDEETIDLQAHKHWPCFYPSASSTSVAGTKIKTPCICRRTSGIVSETLLSDSLSSLSSTNAIVENTPNKKSITRRWWITIH